MQIVASVTTYAGLRDALRERQLELGLTQLELDYLLGRPGRLDRKSRMLGQALGTNEPGLRIGRAGPSDRSHRR